MLGLAGETIVKVVLGVVSECGLVLSDHKQNFTIVHTVLFVLQHWQRVASQQLDKPGPKSGHAAISFTQSQLGNLLLVVGGYGSKGSWIFDMKASTWKRVSVANNWAVTHALTHNTH